MIVLPSSCISTTKRTEANEHIYSFTFTFTVSLFPTVEALTAIGMKTTASRDMTPYSLVAIKRHSEGTSVNNYQVTWQQPRIQSSSCCFVVVIMSFLLEHSSCFLFQQIALFRCSSVSHMDLPVA
jgi:hypothetical protein